MSDSNGPAGGPLTVLSAAGAALARAADLDTALAVIVEAGAAAARASSAAVFTLDADSRALELLLTLGMDKGAVATLEATVGDDPQHPINRAALDRSGSLGREATNPDGQPMTVADLPLVVASGGGAEQCIGVLSFGWPGSHHVDTNQETLLVATADLAAAAISAFRVASMVSERAEWFERITHTDALTGLANARTLARVLELEVARAQRQGSEVSVAVFDIDGFTALNDLAGARAGDTALRQVASILAESVRLVDTIARTGADEFVLIAPGSAGVMVARRVLEGIARLEAIGGQTMTISAGVARFPQDGDDGDSVLAAARAALKGAGERASIAEAAG